VKYAVLSVIGLVLVGIVLLVGWQLWKMGVYKGEIELSAQYDAQNGPVETSLFEMRTTIKNMHQCTDEWADKFIAVVAMQARGRSGVVGEADAKTDGAVNKANAAVAAVAAGGVGVNVSRESEALGIPPELYMKLANAIEGKIGNFVAKQDALMNIWKAHRAYCQDPFHNWLGVALASKVKPQPVMITSQETKDAVTAKKMDEKLF
jgi:hypothetical protein